MTVTTKPRARELGIPLPGTPGPLNAITDVPGIEVGTTELLSSRDPSLATRGIQVQTGVTAILPRGRDPEPKPVWAGQFSLNGNGEMTGAHWVRDGGWLAGRADHDLQLPRHRPLPHGGGALDDRDLRQHVGGQPPLGDAGGGRDL
ncbi:P1 family peptidase [Salipiger sp. CCB-MM3]|uniref:P1 family peptidase n=1 Tax=Salipiger sp. CCB-MM3 TaxID=1792508 RepID=UPI000A414C17|nr:P1 family peptidase [Salipiger sp. CCB-MM3]